MAEASKFESAIYRISGMAAMALYHDVKFKHITILPIENPNGILRLQKKYQEIDFRIKGLLRSPNVKERDTMEKTILVILGGYFAKKIIHPQVKHDLKSSAEWNEAANKAELILDSERQISAYLEYLAVCAEELIEHPVCSEQIRNIAEELKRKQRLTYAVVKAVYHA